MRLAATPFARALAHAERQQGVAMPRDQVADALGVSDRWLGRALQRSRLARVRRGHLIAVERIGRLGLRRATTGLSPLPEVLARIPLPLAVIAETLDLPQKRLAEMARLPDADVPAWVPLALAEVEHAAGPGTALYRWRTQTL